MHKRLILLVFLLFGCAVRPDFFEVNYQLFDNPEKRQIELAYRNDSGWLLCLYPGEWPNAAGKIDGASERVFLIVDGKRFSIEEFNAGYCPWCVLRVAPGEVVSTSIPYRDFSLPERLYDKPKHLEFESRAYNCPSKKFP